MKVKIYDIETLKEFFLICILDPTTMQFVRFRINKNVDEGYAMVRYFESLPEDYFFVGYNNLSFDGQVVEYIIRNYHKWNELSNLEITYKIWEFAQDCIDASNNGRFPPFREEHLNNRQIDLMKIHHFDNEAKMTSLKWLEFMMDMENIQDMPIHHAAVGLTDQDLENIEKYCDNDCFATYKFYLYTIGQVEDHWVFADIYKGKNKVQDRLDLIEEFGFPLNAINWSDVRIGDELNLKGYCERTGKDRNKVYDLKMKRGKTPSITYGDCIPKYVEFETPEFQAFYKSIKGIKLNYVEKQEFKFKYKQTTYTIAKGGIHSTEKKRYLICEEDEDFEDADVGSQYPNAIQKRQLYPSHLGKEWLINYDLTIKRRFAFKERGATEKKYKGLSDMLKLALNGGGFGKTNETTSWQYDPRVTFFCTIGNQFEILMLIEKLEMNGISCVSANTDGIVCKFKKSLRPKYDEICKWWEEKVGNSVQGKLEYTSFKALYQTSVNSYIAIKADGSVKKKGIFGTDFEFNKNKSRRIVPLALEEYYKNGTDPEVFIKNHKNVFDFAIGVKGNRKYRFRTVDPKTQESTIYEDKVIRYLVSTKGKILFKEKKPEYVDENGNEFTHCEAPDSTTGKQFYTIIFNQYNKDIPIADYNIDYDYYLNKINEIIDTIKRQGNKRKTYNNPNQLNLF